MLDDANDDLVIQEDLTKETKEEKKSPLAEKSVDELISMNEEAQKQISRQGNEIGELRDLTSEILRKQAESTAPKKEAPEADWDYSPKEAAEQLINSKVDSLEAKIEEQQSQNALHAFASKHPNYREVAASDKFREWVTQSPVRTRMYDEGNAGNFTYADELFTEWSKVSTEEGKPETKQDTKQALRDAKLESGAGTPDTKKVYNRKQLIKLRLRDPDAYEARLDEFRLAYQEGRVR